jgi:hypothetical protein
MISFKEWFLAQETMTSTGCVVGFSRPIGIGMVRRKFPKKVMEQTQVKEVKDYLIISDRPVG